MLLISGGCYVPAHLVLLQGVLKAYGYHVASPRLPPNNLYPPKGAFEHAKNLSRGIAKSLANQGKEAIVLMHTYGGFLGPEAMAGLAVKDRAAQGLKGGVKWLAYTTTLILAK